MVRRSPCCGLEYLDRILFARRWKTSALQHFSDRLGKNIQAERLLQKLLHSLTHDLPSFIVERITAGQDRADMRIDGLDLLKRFTASLSGIIRSRITRSIRPTQAAVSGKRLFAAVRDQHLISQSPEHLAGDVGNDLFVINQQEWFPGLRLSEFQGPGFSRLLRGMPEDKY